MFAKTISTVLSQKSIVLNRRQISWSWQHKFKMADNAGQFIKIFSYSSNKNILMFIF